MHRRTYIPKNLFWIPQNIINILKSIHYNCSKVITVLTQNQCKSHMMLSATINVSIMQIIILIYCCETCKILAHSWRYRWVWLFGFTFLLAWSEVFSTILVDHRQDYIYVHIHAITKSQLTSFFTHHWKAKKIFLFQKKN